MELDFLESPSNVKRVLTTITGRTPNSRVAHGLAVQLQQGRLGWRFAPLLLYYGTMAYARTLVCASKLSAPETLPPRHGVKDKSDARRLADLRVRIGKRGTFQCFNDVARDVRLRYYDAEQMPQFLSLTAAASSAALAGMELSIRDVLARVPGLADHYVKTSTSPLSRSTCI